jgi:hypothetical protein
MKENWRGEWSRLRNCITIIWLKSLLLVELYVPIRPRVHFSKRLSVLGLNQSQFYSLRKRSLDSLKDVSVVLPLVSYISKFTKKNLSLKKCLNAFKSYTYIVLPISFNLETVKNMRIWKKYRYIWKNNSYCNDYKLLLFIFKTFNFFILLFIYETNGSI